MFLTSIIAIGQNISIENPPKKTWKILIKNSNNKEVNYQLIGQVLIDNDFLIEKNIGWNANVLPMYNFGDRISKITTGRMKNYSLETAVMIAEALEISVDEIVELKNIKKENN